MLTRQAGLALDLFARQEIFTPLGMTHTRFNPPAEWKPQIPPTEDDRTFRRRIIQGEVNDENASVMGGVAGHAGVFAPAIDIARFAECMLHSGAPILKPETVQLFTRRVESPAGSSRALGWDTPSAPASSGTHFSAESFGHLGFTGTSLWIDPTRQLSVTLADQPHLAKPGVASHPPSPATCARCHRGGAGEELILAGSAILSPIRQRLAPSRGIRDAEPQRDFQTYLSCCWLSGSMSLL